MEEWREFQNQNYVLDLVQCFSTSHVTEEQNEYFGEQLENDI